MRLAVSTLRPCCLAFTPAKAEFLMLSAPDAPATQESRAARASSETQTPPAKNPCLGPRAPPLRLRRSGSLGLRGPPDRPNQFPGRLCRCGPKGRHRRLEGRRAMAGDPRRRRAPAWARRHRQRAQGDHRGAPSSLNKSSAEPLSLFAQSSLSLSHVHMETAS